MNEVRVITLNNEVRIVAPKAHIALTADQAVDLAAALIKHGVELHRDEMRRCVVPLVTGGIA